MEHNIKNPSGKLVMNGTSFNEFYVISKKEEEFVEEQLKSLANTHFFGNRSAEAKVELLKSVYVAARSLTASKQPAPVQEANEPEGTGPASTKTSKSAAANK